MNADDFYEDFRAALQFLGLAWGEKECADVCVKDGCLVISYKAKSVSIAL